MEFSGRTATKRHIKRVQEIIGTKASILLRRGYEHDSSELEDPEVSLFDEMTPKLAESTYGSPEYTELLTALKPALDHHYAVNSHHPEQHTNGISGMTLMDIVEMFCDWKAASERHINGNFERSIKINTTRFNMDKQLVDIFENTRKELNL